MLYLDFSNFWISINSPYKIILAAVQQCVISLHGEVWLTKMLLMQGNNQAATLHCVYSQCVFIKLLVHMKMPDSTDDA